jgi:hypothetical protein
LEKGGAFDLHSPPAPHRLDSPAADRLRQIRIFDSRDLTRLNGFDVYEASRHERQEIS